MCFGCGCSADGSAAGFLVSLTATHLVVVASDAVRDNRASHFFSAAIERRRSMGTFWTRK